MSFFQPGTLYQAIDKSAAMNTNPWNVTDRTLTHIDHVCIEPGNVVLLLKHIDLGSAAIYIWLFETRVVWQILKDNIFDEYWRPLEINF